MAAKYPRLGYNRKKSNAGKPRCEACYESATRRLEIQFGYMRGTDDENYEACDSHAKLAETDIDAFLEAVQAKCNETKAKEISGSELVGA